MFRPAKNLIVLMSLFSSEGMAQTDSTKKSGKWYKPAGVVAEYAGGFGVFSAGILFEPFKKYEISLTAGHTPPEFGNIWTANLLISYEPWKVSVTDNLSVSLLKSGVFTSVNFNRNIPLTWTKDYPEDYYWWSSSFRFGPFINTELKLKPENSKMNYIYFFRCLTNDLYLAGIITNYKELGIKDILVLGMGFKVMWP
jgi:hypothetical protein